jgi:hypothetical protein
MLLAFDKDLMSTECINLTFDFWYLKIQKLSLAYCALKKKPKQEKK